MRWNAPHLYVIWTVQFNIIPGNHDSRFLQLAVLVLKKPMYWRQVGIPKQLQLHCEVYCTPQSKALSMNGLDTPVDKLIKKHGKDTRYTATFIHYVQRFGMRWDWCSFITVSCPLSCHLVCTAKLPWLRSIRLPPATDQARRNNFYCMKKKN